jgi:hypothetical protein
MAGLPCATFTSNRAWLLRLGKWHMEPEQVLKVYPYRYVLIASGTRGTREWCRWCIVEIMPEVSIFAKINDMLDNFVTVIVSCYIIFLLL